MAMFEIKSMEDAVESEFYCENGFILIMEGDVSRFVDIKEIGFIDSFYTKRDKEKEETVVTLTLYTSKWDYIIQAECVNPTVAIEWRTRIIKQLTLLKRQYD